MSVRVEIKGEKAVQAMFAKLSKSPDLYKQEIRRSTNQLEAIVKTNFLTVKDGTITSDMSSGRKSAPRRTKKPGLRSVTGFLLQNTRGVIRQSQGGNIEGAVGTNVEYGIIQERKGKYAFLLPALEKIYPIMKKRMSAILKAGLRK